CTRADSVRSPEPYSFPVAGQRRRSQRPPARVSRPRRSASSSSRFSLLLSFPHVSAINPASQISSSSYRGLVVVPSEEPAYGTLISPFAMRKDGPACKCCHLARTRDPHDRV